jgi:KDO2-lipid IV(A) lauroyltransferase
MKRRSDYAAYLAMRAAGAAIMALPRPLARGAGAMLGRTARALGMRRTIADANLAIAFPEKPAEERDAIARGVFAHFGRMAIDSLRLSAGGPSAVVPLVSGGECVELVRERLPRGKGVIILTGHVGNWELAGAYIAASGIRLAAVVKPPANPHIAAHAEAVRRRLGIETIPMPEARSGVLEALRQGKAVALVADQGALRSSTWTPFFGRPTKTPSGPDVFAARSGAPVLFGALIAQPDGRYHLDGEVLVEDASTGDPAAETVARLYRAALERLVRQVPAQYLWTHRLWKQQPPAAPGGP